MARSAAVPAPFVLAASESVRQAWRALWLSRLVVWVAGVGAVQIWGASSRAPAFDPGAFTTPFGAFANTLIAPAARWDAVWYLAITRDGYDSAQKAAFFPLYPTLVHAAGFVVGSPVLAAMLVSTVCFMAALVVVGELARLELGDGAARWTVAALAFSPMSFFFSAVYSESLFLALSAGAVLAARRDRWALAGVLGALSAATRSAGVLVVVALVWLAVTRRARWRDAAWVALVPCGLAAFVAALALAGQDAFAPFHAQAVWFRSFGGPFSAVWDGAVAAWDGTRQLVSGSAHHVYFARAAGDPFAIARINLALFGWVVLAVVALAGAARRLPAAYAGYAFAALALPLSYPVGPQPLMSLPRFVLVLFPLWMWLGDWLHRHPRARVPVLVAGGAGLAASAAQFATWHFVA